MSRVEQQLCDGCGALITGKYGIEYQRKPGILIKGQIAVFEVDPLTRWRDHLFITPTPDADLSFCKLDCIGAYIDHRKIIAASKRKESLKEDADREYRERMRKDPDFIVGTKR